MSINYVIAKNGRITNYEEAVAVVIRDEEIVDTSSYSGEMQIVQYDGSRVSKGDIITSFVGKKDEDYIKNLNEIDNQIQLITENSQVEPSLEIKNIEKTIENEIYDLLGNKNSIYDVNISKKSIYNNLEKKINLVGDNYPNSDELKKLLKERNEIEKQTNDSKVYLKANRPGLVSYRVDGYENDFNAKSFAGLSLKNIKSIKYLPNQQVPISTDKVKIINNFYNYLVVSSKSENLKNLHLGDTLRISIDKNFQTFEKASIDYIIDNEDERIIVIKVYDNIEKLSQYRKINCYIIWWNYEGIKIQNDAIYEASVVNEESGEIYTKLSAVKVLGTTGYQKEIWVKVENSAEGFSIVSNYEDNELIEMGIPRNMVENRNKLNLYDRVIILK